MKSFYHPIRLWVVRARPDVGGTEEDVELPEQFGLKLAPLVSRDSKRCAVSADPSVVQFSGDCRGLDIGYRKDFRPARESVDNSYCVSLTLGNW